SAAQQFEAGSQPVTQFIRREEPEARGSQLDGQRQTIQPGTDVDSRRGVLLGQFEARLDLTGALDEQVHSFITGEGFEGWKRATFRKGQRGNREEVLAPHSERFSTGYQHLEPK